MKPRSYLVPIVLAIALLASLQTNTAQTGVPEVSGLFYYSDDRGSLTPLERTVGIPSVSFVEVSGQRAAVRLKAQGGLHFVVRLPKNASPEKFELVRFSVGDGVRRVGANQRGRGVDPASKVPYTIERVGEELYRFTPTQVLPPGEYSFSANDSNEAFCFGIDDQAPRPEGPKVSHLSIVTQPGGVQVYVDDRFKGVSGEENGTLVIEGLAPSSHQLRLTLPGYKEWSQNVTLTAGETLPVTAKLARAGPKPLALEEVEEALKNGLAKRQIRDWVKQFGVDFAMSPEREQRLRDAGADGELLYLITQSKK